MIFPQSEFSIPQARRLISDLFRHRPVIYWVDFLASLTIGYGFASLYLSAPLGSWQQVLALVIASFALFRAGSFIHEIVHFRKGEMRWFVVAFDLLAGVPMLMPSFFYGNHIDHHNTRHYGTGQDGEYLPLGSGPLRNVALFYAQVVFLPAMVSARFLIGTPISFLHPRLRNWVLTHWSSYVINLCYRRRQIPPDAPRAYWAFIEVLCFLRIAAMFAVVAVGAAPPHRIALLYVIAMCVLGLNYIRNLTAHLYQGDGEAMTHEEQLFDSVNIEGGKVLGGPITELFFPLGLRYHALHHLFPALPYHNLYAAHRRLMQELPPDSGYRRTVFPTFWAAAAVLQRQAREAAILERRKEATGADRWFEARQRLIEGYARRERDDAANAREDQSIRRSEIVAVGARGNAEPEVN
jgi:fatty acid desaturase